jgi:hypothetical protein
MFLFLGRWHMKKVILKNISMLIVLILISGMFLQIISSNGLMMNDSESPNNPQDPQEANSIDWSSKLSKSTNQPYEYNGNGRTRATYYDQIIDSNKIYNEDKTIKNLTILKDGTLNIENCNIIILGKLTVKNNGRLFVKNSNITIKPGSEGPQVIIINFSDKAKIRIEDSNFYTYPQPTLTNISYLLSDDESEVTIINSYMNCKLPAILNMDIVLTPPTAGTFILTGDCKWNIYDTKIEGFLKIVDNELLGRWFLFTLQRNAQLYMKSTIGFLNDGSQPFIKPVAGFVKLEDCRIPFGVIDVEVVAEFEAINLTIEELHLRDQTKSRIISSNIEDNLDSGSVAIVPDITGNGSAFMVSQEKPKTIVYAEKTNIGQIFFSQGNSTNEFVNCKIGTCMVIDNGTVKLDESEIITLAEVKDNGRLVLKNSSAFTINIGESGSLETYQSPEIPPINKLTTGFNCQGTIKLSSTTINLLNIYGGDQVLPPYDQAYDPKETRSKITIDLLKSVVKELKTEDDSEITISSEDSEITQLSFKKVKQESVKIIFLDLGSTFILPETWPDINLEIEIYHRVTFNSKVNGQPVKSKIIIINEEEQIIETLISDESGSSLVDLFYEKLVDDTSEPAGTYDVEVTYLGFSKNFQTEAKINDNYDIDWTDNNPPVISNIRYDDSYHVTGRPTRIRATIIDSDIKAISNATIYYQYTTENGWSDWFEGSMLEIGNNTFEGEIKDFDDGTKVRFYIESYDILGNRIVSEKRSYSLENPDILVILGGLIFIIILILISIFYFAKKRAKYKKYISKTSKKDQRV